MAREQVERDGVQLGRGELAVHHDVEGAAHHREIDGPAGRASHRLAHHTRVGDEVREAIDRADRGLDRVERLRAVVAARDRRERDPRARSLELRLQ